MDLHFLEDFCHKKGQVIASILLDTHDSADFESNALSIERDIYDIATSYAKIQLFEAKTTLNPEARQRFRFLIRTRFDVKERGVQKMKDIDLVAHWIKAEAIKNLKEHGIITVGL